jgi:alpha-galactosidase
MAKASLEKNMGHAAHSQAADSQSGLPGRITRKIKITFIGAGSMFTPRLISDVLRIPNAVGGTFALVDIDPTRLRVMQQLVTRMVAADGGRWKVEASTDRKKVLRGSDYLVNCIEVSGTDCVRFDNDIPAKYGIDQCIGDTIGPGGLFKGLRTVPVFLEVLQDCEKFCPDVIVLNYTNPMNMLCLAAGRTSPVQVVGLCHSVQGTSHLLAQRAGVPYEEMEWECAGINHLAWFTKLKHQGQDLYPRLKDAARRDLDKAFREGPPRRVKGDPLELDLPEHHRDLVRKDMMLHFGAFITESSGHLSEYLPYYRKRKDLLRKYMRPGFEGGSRFYADSWPIWRKNADRDRSAMLAGRKPFPTDRSWEYASWIIEAREKDVPFRFHGNVMNRDGVGGTLITNLPADGCVEVACFVDRNGIQPTRYGALPPQMAAVCASNMNMFDLAANAAIRRSKQDAIYALLLDPLTAAVCSPAEIEAMTLELFEAEARFLPGYR